MDTGTANVDVGYSDLNRLYYRSGVAWFSGSSQAINNENIEITVTHIRPNDGHYENTVNEQQNLQKINIIGDYE